MNAQDATTTAGALATTAGAMLIAFGLRALGAIAVWFVGRWLIGLVVRLLGRARCSTSTTRAAGGSTRTSRSTSADRFSASAPAF